MYDGDQCTIVYPEDWTERTAFRYSMKKKLGVTRFSGRDSMRNAYCTVFGISPLEYAEDCRNFSIPSADSVSPLNRPRLIVNCSIEALSQDSDEHTNSKKRKNPNQKRDEVRKKLRQELEATKAGLKAAAVAMAFTSSFNQYQRHHTICNKMLKEAGSHVRLPPIESVKQDGKHIFEQSAAGVESSIQFLTPKIYHQSTREFGMTRLIKGIQCMADETITITNLLRPAWIEILKALTDISLEPKCADFQEENISAKLGFKNKNDMQIAVTTLEKLRQSSEGESDSICWRVWKGRSHRMVVDLCADLIDSVTLLILSAGTERLSSLSHDITLYIIFWQDNRTATTHCKIRLMDPTYILFKDGVSNVSNLLSFVGGENKLPTFMKFAIQQFDKLLDTKFEFNNRKIEVKIKFNTADHHALYTILRKPCGKSSWRDCFGITDVNHCDTIIWQGHSIFSMSILLLHTL